MSINAIIVMSTLLIGSGVMYWLQKWTDSLNRQVQLSLAQPLALKVVEVAIESNKPMLGRTDERVAISFEVQLPLRAPYMVRTPWLVEASQINHLHTGMLLPVKIEARSGKVIFPNISWAAYDWRREAQVLPLPETPEKAIT